jgi:hypothetical protein
VQMLSSEAISGDIFCFLWINGGCVDDQVSLSSECFPDIGRRTAVVVETLLEGSREFETFYITSSTTQS